MGQSSGAQRRFGRDRTFLAEDDWFVARAHGTVAVAGRNVLYTPQAGFTGTDTFQYRLSYNDETEVATATVIVRNR
jgi:hypothetical protein